MCTRAVGFLPCYVLLSLPCVEASRARDVETADCEADAEARGSVPNLMSLDERLSRIEAALRI